MKRALTALWVPTLILAIWELGSATGLLNPVIFPPPSQLALSTRDMIARGELQMHLKATFTRLALGFLLGSILGLACGVAMGLKSWIKNSLEPTISGAYAMPKISLLPLLMLFMGVGEPARILLIAVGCFVLMAIHGMDALQHVNRRYVEMAMNYGATRLAIVHKVYMPACLPQIFTGFRIALGRALTMTIALELVSCPDGLGSMIWMAWQTFYTEKLYVGVLLSAALGALLHFSLKHLEAKLVPWKN
jgi:ABC-type nitrate/sulfonate/bicarbonate transport system permease component